MTKRNDLAPIIAGLAVGIGFIISLAIALQPMIISPRQFPDEYKPMIAKSRESEAVKIFLQRHPFAHVQEVHEGAAEMIVIRYGGVSETWINYKYPSVLVHHHSASLTVYVDGEGNITNLELRCGTWYPEGAGGMSSVVDGSYYGMDFIVQLVKEGWCHI